MAQNPVWLGEKHGKNNERSKKKSDEELMGTNAGKQEQKEGGGVLFRTPSYHPTILAWCSFAIFLKRGGEVVCVCVC